MKTSTTNPPAALPAYRRIAFELRSLLEQAGNRHEKLPTEAEISAKYDVSRQTARRAYQELVTEGLVDRVAGRGSFASPRGPYVRSLGSVEDLMALAEDTTLEVVDPLKPAHASPRMLAELGGTEVYEVAIRRLSGAVPFVYTEIVLPGEIGRRLRRSFLTQLGSKRSTTVIELLDRRLGVAIATSHQEITLARLPRKAANAIEMRPGEPALRIDRTYRDRAGRGVEMTTNYFNPERYTYRLELRRTSSST